MLPDCPVPDVSVRADCRQGHTTPSGQLVRTLPGPLRGCTPGGVAIHCRTARSAFFRGNVDGGDPSPIPNGGCMAEDRDDPRSRDDEIEPDEISEAESLFKQLDLFEQLTDEEVREMVRACDLLEYEAGDVLFEQDDEADALYIINNGELEVASRSAIGEEVVLARLQPGTAVGEMSLIEGGPRSATVQAVTDAEVFRLDHDTFDQMRRDRRPAAYKIILGLAATVGDRRRNTDARVQEVFDDPADHIDSFESQLNEMLGQLRKS